jgi:hypothetical protein
MLVKARWTGAMVTTALVLILIVVAPPANAAGLAGDISIRSVRLTDRLVMRIEATYVCPAGFAVPPSWLPRATVSQQGDVGASSQHKKFDGILCDGTQRTVLVRFVTPRHGDHWLFDALTQVTLNFRATMDQAPYSSVFPQDTQMVMTRAAAHAEVVADLTISRVALSDRGVLRAKASYLCPVGMTVQPSLPPFAGARQETTGSPMSQKSFGGVVCDGTRRELLVRFPHPRSPSGTQWQAGAMTHIDLYFQASVESPWRYVLAMDAQSSIV